MPIKTRKAKAKSTSPASALAIGMTNRGKYTFEMRLALDTRLFDDWVTAYEKNVQGTRAQYANSGYGTPSDGILANLPKTTVKRIMVMTGCRIAHDAPKNVCL